MLVRPARPGVRLRLLRTFDVQRICRTAKVLLEEFVIVPLNLRLRQYDIPLLYLAFR